MTEITTTDLRRWQYAAINVLTQITGDAPPDLSPITWRVATTAQLQGEPGSGTRTERLASLRAWADHLGITLKDRPGTDGLVSYHGTTERTAKNGKSVTISLHLRDWPDNA
ncbi:hypothetical protein [Streptomyces sp. NRRL S-31]|uniref:hypothetical protein n=1 Tax=Streptomyces sp. NRRL S-31 TaxID=1463898 RepID=UPI0004CAA683|nr:hypothetical protein [Streptomyces sp. NRRL S-31]